MTEEMERSELVRKDARFAYEVNGAGWAVLQFRTDQAAAEPLRFAVSYLHDSLGDLAAMGLALQKGAVRAQAVFMDEPGEVMLVAVGEKDLMRFELREYRDWASWGVVAVDDYELMASGEIRRADLVHNIHAILERIYLDVGMKKYRELWCQHDFPLQTYERLSIALHKHRMGR